MAESMSGLAKSHRCTEVSNKLIRTEVTVMGWVQKRRNLGSLIFVDLRDRSGILQLVFDQEVLSEEDYNKANSLRSEYVVAAVGTVEKRSAAINENLKTEISRSRYIHCVSYQNQKLLHFQLTRIRQSKMNFV